MKTTLIAPTPPDVAAFGLRALSAYLKRAGKDVRLIFLPGGVEQFKYHKGFRYRYESQIIEQLVELCRGSGLIGISFMSNYLDRGMQLSQEMKRAFPQTPLILGGIHPTVMPVESLEFSDIVCVGEGEEAVLELIEHLEDGRDYSGIRNLTLKKDGNLVRNPLRPLCNDLDEYPYFDFSMQDHFMYSISTGRIEPMNKELLQHSFPLEPHVEGSFADSYKRTISYKTMTTRGCPHHCTFCAERTMGLLYEGQKYLRKRSVPHIIGELKWVRQEMPFVESIFLFDDTFLVRTNAEIQEFAGAYKKEIGLPFHIQASPTTTTDEKIDALVDAGLKFVEVGIQSTSERTKQLYRRTVKEETILSAARILKRVTGRIEYPCYHVILDNPWETTQDVRETLMTVLKLPRPFWLKRASLVCFPGTELFDMAKRDGFIRNEEEEWEKVYAKHLHTPHGKYINFLMYLAGFSYFPRWMVRALASDPMIALLDRKALEPLYFELNHMGERLIVLWKGIRSVFTGDFGRIRRYLRRISAKTS